MVFVANWLRALHALLQIPNPLFDLAGITCGHFLIPFGTFFGATLIGKAVIKMHIQVWWIITTVVFELHTSVTTTAAAAAASTTVY